MAARKQSGLGWAPKTHKRRATKAFNDIDKAVRALNSDLRERKCRSAVVSLLVIGNAAGHAEANVDRVSSKQQKVGHRATEAVRKFFKVCSVNTKPSKPKR